MKLNLGSGQRPFGEGWTNVDAQAKWNPDIVADIKHLPMIADGSAEMVVLHQVCEHAWAEDARAILRECYRMLEPGGSLIITVPDMRKLAMMWMRGEMDTALYMINVYGAFMGHPEDLHRYGYTGQTLSEMLFDNGNWSAVKSFDWRPIEGADIARDDRWILGIEAVK